MCLRVERDYCVGGNRPVLPKGFDEKLGVITSDVVNRLGGRLQVSSPERNGEPPHRPTSVKKQIGGPIDVGMTVTECRNRVFVGS